MRIKCGRKEYEVSSEDLIMDNGSCYQLILKRGNIYGECNPIVSKSLFNQLLKEGKIAKSHTANKWCVCIYYKFINKI